MTDEVGRRTVSVLDVGLVKRFCSLASVMAPSDMQFGGYAVRGCERP